MESKRRDKGLTQYMWATGADLSESTLKRFLRGEPINPENFENLCKVLGIEEWMKLIEKEDSDSTVANINPTVAETFSTIEPERSRSVASAGSPNEDSPKSQGKSKGQLVVTGIFDEDQKLEIEALLDHLKALLLKCTVTIKVSDESEVC